MIGEREFRELMFVNPARLHAGMNPDFFAGTVCEAAVRDALRADAAIRRPVLRRKRCGAPPRRS